MVDFSQIDVNQDLTLYPYQTANKAKVYEFWGKGRSVMLQMPTGTGKTRLFVSIAKDLHNWGVKNKRAVKILFLVHRIELVNQICRTLRIDYNLATGVIMAGNTESKQYPIQVGSVPTLNRRLDNWTSKEFDVIVIDEAHHTTAESYKKILKAYPTAKVLGVTATPYRLSGVGFGSEYEDLITSNSISKFIADGRLCNYQYYSIRPYSQTQQEIEKLRLGFDGDYLESDMEATLDKDHIRAKIVETYLRYAKGKKGIVYTINQQHNKHVCEQFELNGISSRAIDCKTKREERDKIVNDFKNGAFDVLCNVNIFSEGFDCPDIEFVQLARPTKSLSMYLQQIGRGLRTSKDKEFSIFLDNVGLYNRFGLPSANRKWRHHFEGRKDAVEFVSDSNQTTPVIFMDDVEEGDAIIELIHQSKNEAANIAQIDDDMRYSSISYTNPNIENFAAYLRKINCKESTIRVYISTIINVLDPHLKGLNYLHTKVFDILDIDKLREIKSKVLDVSNSDIYTRCITPLNKYIDYVEYIENIDSELHTEPKQDDLSGDMTYINHYINYLKNKGYRKTSINVYKTTIANLIDQYLREVYDSNHSSVFNTTDIDAINAMKSTITMERLGNRYPRFIAPIDRYIEFANSYNAGSQIAVDETEPQQQESQHIRPNKQMLKYEQQYKQYLRSQGLAINTVNNYTCVICKYIDSIIKQNIDENHSSIYNIDDAELLEFLLIELQEDPTFVRLNREKHNSMTASLKRYMDFIKSLSEPQQQNNPQTMIPNTEISPSSEATTTPNSRTLDEVYKAIEVLKGLNIPIPETLDAERVFLERKKHIHENLPKMIEEQIEGLFDSIQEDVEIQLSYSNVGGLTVRYKTSEQNFENRAERRTVRRGKLKVTFPDGDVIQCNTDIQTLIDVIKRIGVAKVEALNIRCAGSGLIDKQISSKPQISKRQIEIESGFWINTHTNSLKKKSVLEKISMLIGLRLKVEV